MWGRSCHRGLGFAGLAASLPWEVGRGAGDPAAGAPRAARTAQRSSFAGTEQPEGPASARARQAEQLSKKTKSFFHRLAFTAMSSWCGRPRGLSLLLALVGLAGADATAMLAVKECSTDDKPILKVRQLF